MTPDLSLTSRGEQPSTERRVDDRDHRDDAGGDGGRGAPPLIARLLYGGVLAFMGANHFRNTESMVGYAESKGIPMADLAVPFSGGMLISGGLGIVLWRFPRLAAGAVATFFLGVTPTMHDFWNFEGQERQQQMNNFLKNVGLFAAAVALLSRPSE